MKENLNWFQTCWHCCPVETPTRQRGHVIRLEDDVHSVRDGCVHYEWPQVTQVAPMLLMTVSCRAGCLVHQNCPVPISDYHMVAKTTTVTRTPINMKVGEHQLQHLATLHCYCLCLFNAVRVVVRVVGREDSACV